MGTGVDLCEVDRIKKAICSDHGARLVERVFTAREIAYSDSKANRYERYAARFAAKEAGMKALGTGWSNGVGWKDFEVRHDPHGRPHLYVTGRAAEIAHALGATHATISLAHDGGVATAVVAIEGDGPPPEAHSFTTGRTRIGVEAPAFVPFDAAPPADPA